MPRIKLDKIDLFMSTSVTSISPSKTVVFSNSTEKNKKIAFERLILATGSREKPFGALGIPSDRPAGIYGAGLSLV